MTGRGAERRGAAASGPYDCSRKKRYPKSAPPRCASYAMWEPPRRNGNAMIALNATSTMAKVRAFIGMGIGMMIISASGQSTASATARPRIAPDAPTKGATTANRERISAKMAAPTPQ